MDTQTGKVYETRDAAIADGVPAERIAELYRPTSGPFKGRVYKRTAHGLVRMNGGRFSKRYITKTDGEGNEIRVKNERDEG